jgi:hypothetical protein
MRRRRARLISHLGYGVSRLGSPNTASAHSTASVSVGSVRAGSHVIYPIKCLHSALLPDRSFFWHQSNNISSYGAIGNGVGLGLSTVDIGGGGGGGSDSPLYSGHSICFRYFFKTHPVGRDRARPCHPAQARAHDGRRCDGDEREFGRSS